MNKPQIHAIKWINLSCIMLNESNQTQNAPCSTAPFYMAFSQGESIGRDKSPVVARRHRGRCLYNRAGANPLELWEASGS